MENAFAKMMTDLFADRNVGIDIVYRPPSGTAISCRGILDEETTDFGQMPGKVRDRKRVLLVRTADIATPETGATVEIPTGGTSYRVFDYTESDPQEATWRLEVALP
jgi:hypothetical protein